jgi:histidinol-phosphate phosphatase family protein
MPEPLRPIEDVSLVALCPGVQYGTAKRWPLARYAEAAARLAAAGVAGVVVGSREEHRLGERILRVVGAKAPRFRARWRNACGAGSLLLAAEVLRRASAVVCNDTGTMHLAAAVGTPVVALFGPTDPRWTGPCGEGHRVLRRAFPCAPCLRRRCPYGDPAPCLAAIPVSEVEREVRRLCEHRSRVAPETRRPALFLDRDGTLVKHEPYLHDPARVRLISGSAAALRRAQAAGYLLVVVTNQSGIARGLFDRSAVDAVHDRLQQLLAVHGVALDGIYVCPHHPEFGDPCSCRKPAPGLLQRAIEELPVDPGRSVMIGDTVEDLQAGAAAGMRLRLVRTGYGDEQARTRADQLPTGTRVVADLPAVVDELA